MPTHFTRLFAICVVLTTFASSLSAQRENLTDDLLFFQKQQKEYQRWLDQTGIGKTLHVADIDVKKDYFTLFLGFDSKNLDTIVNSWNQVKSQYETAQNLALEAQLFFRMVNLMGLSQDICCVKIFDTYNMSRTSLFNVTIYYDKGKLQIEKGGSKGEPKKIQISKKDLSGAKKLSEAAFSKQYTQEFVYDKITEFLKQKYSKSPCDQRNPSANRLPNEDYLIIEVSDLCKEVLKSAENPTQMQRRARA